MTDFEEYRKYPLHDSIEYAHMLRKLFPYGRLWGYLLPSEDDIIYDSYDHHIEWNDDPSSGTETLDTNASQLEDKSSVLGKFMLVIGEELKRLEERAFALINESTAGLSVEMIDEYKEQYIREDEEALITSDEDIARLAHGKEYNEATAFTAANAEAYGATLDFDITVNENPTSSYPAICGVAVCGNERCGGRGAFSIVEIIINDGDGNLELMQALFEKYKPAHVVIIWDDQR